MVGVMDIFTEHSIDYDFYPVSCGSVQFKVRAKSDAHLALTSDAKESGNMYEVFIGGWRNTKSVIRKDKTQPDKVEVETPNILSKDEYRSFTVRWDYGTIAVNREGEREPFMTWTDPAPMPINYVGVCTGWGATGTWKIEDANEFNTPDKLEYKFRPVTAGYLQFEYRGPHNAHVFLSNKRAENELKYEIVLGAKNNTETLIRRSDQTFDQMTVPTPGLVQPNEFKKFLIEWKNGRQIVRDATPPGPVLLDWEDRSSFPVTHFGVRTSNGARGHWRIQHFPDTSNGSIVSELNDGTVGKWVGAVGGAVPAGAAAAGRDAAGGPVYVARAMHNKDIVPGKLQPGRGYACIAYGGAEYAKTNYQVLVGGSDNWVQVTGAKIPEDAFPAGETEDGETLYVGRVRVDGQQVCGKVQRSHGVCYVPHNGLERAFPEYEILLF